MTTASCCGKYSRWVVDRQVKTEKKKSQSIQCHIDTLWLTSLKLATLCKNTHTKTQALVEFISSDVFHSHSQFSLQSYARQSYQSDLSQSNLINITGPGDKELCSFHRQCSVLPMSHFTVIPVGPFTVEPHQHHQAW